MTDAQAISMSRLRKKFTGGAATRKAGEQAVRGVVDGRSLRATGRSEQFNFRTRAGLKETVRDAATAEGVTVAEWMERAIELALGDGGNL